MMKIVLVVLALCSCTLALSVLGNRGKYACEDPRPYYGNYIYSERATPCADETTAQCVSVVFELCGAPSTGSWVKGLKVNDNCASIPTQTAIASFSGNGGTAYNGNEGHAAVFLRCESDGSVTVADQWCGQVVHERTLHKSCTSSNPYSNCADYFYVIN